MKKSENKFEFFFLMGEREREKVEKWFNSKSIQHKLYTLNFNTEEYEFLTTVKAALDRIDYDYQIATIEPSKTTNKRIFYKKHCKVPVDTRDYMSVDEWEKAAIDFYYDDEWKSDIATIYELYLWYAYRIAMKYWTLEYVCVNSSLAGNYNKSHGFEKSGVRKVGGFEDGIGNTFKLVKWCSGIVAIGGSNFTSGSEFPVATISEVDDVIIVESVAAVVLKPV